MGREEDPSLAPRALAVRAVNPSFLVSSTAAAMICSLVNMNFLGIALYFLLGTYVVQHLCFYLTFLTPKRQAKLRSFVTFGYACVNKIPCYDKKGSFVHERGFMIHGKGKRPDNCIFKKNVLYIAAVLAVISMFWFIRIENIWNTWTTGCLPCCFV